MTISETDRTATPNREYLGLVARFAPGQLIAGRFSVVRHIARGGMGEVYEVEDQFLQKVHVALKVIAPEFALDSGSAHRFEQEVLLARKVAHPNLCPIYDIARCVDPFPPFLFLTMRLLAGETLSSRLLRAEPIPREEAITVIRQLVSGIAALHAAGVIHRDIKPNNVMLERSGKALCISIMDFGLARLHDENATVATTSVIAGTPGYMAPEILQGGSPSQAADLFALGVLLHQVLTGEHPKFKPLSLAVEALPKLDTSDAPLILIHWVKELLAHEPIRRSVAFNQMKAKLVSGDASTLSASHGALDPSGPLRVTRRQFVVGSSVVAGAAATGLIWKRDRLHDIMIPLPKKRFVALVGWPIAAEELLNTTISAVVDAIASELSRAEAFDHDLLIIPRSVGKDVSNIAQLNTVRESVGANMVLAISGFTTKERFHLLLNLIDPATATSVREKKLSIRLQNQLQLPEMAVRAAADLLSINRYQPDDERSKVGTTNQKAYAAFQAAEELRKQDNEAGLGSAIEKYKEAIEIDPRYADAQSRLAWAYLRLYGLLRDPGALDLAGLNLKAAIASNPDLADAHVGLASYYHQTGDDRGKSREIVKALALDPTNTHALTYQANFYADDNQWDAAEATFKRISSLRPNYWFAHNEYGAVLEDQAKYPEALEEFRSGNLLSPKNASTFKAVGSVYLRLGRIPEALENLNTSYAMNPGDQAAIALAEAFRLERKYPEAIDFAQRAVKSNPKEALYWLELGDIYAEFGRNKLNASVAYSRATTTEQDRLRTTPKSGPGWMILALCRAKAGERETALALIEKAESLHADDMDSQLAKVRALELAGQPDRAWAAMARCLQRGPTIFQFESMPDLQRVRATPEFKKLLSTNLSDG